MTRVVISGISTISAAGQDFNDIHKKLIKGKSSLAPIDYLDSNSFSGTFGGSLNSVTWEKIRTIAREQSIDNNSAFAILSIKSLLANFNPGTRNIALSLGTCNGGIDSLSRFYDTSDEQYLTKYPVYRQAADIARYFGFSGSKFLFNSACSASGLSIAYAAELIKSHKAEVVITGGSDPMSKWVYAGFNSLRTFNANNCKPYSTEFGLNLGEAATYFILEDMQRAKKLHHKIFAEVLGYGTSNDAFHPTAPDENGQGIAQAIEGALKDSSLKPSDVDYVNSHGTGTRANDAAEFAGIKSVFSEKLPLISSMKGYVGHNLGAAASTELALSLIGINRGVIYANYGLDEYREGCNDEHIIQENHPVTGDITMINNNAAFGGHNVAVAFKVSVGSGYQSKEKSRTEHHEVYVNSIAWASESEAHSATQHYNFSSKNILKEVDLTLYQRRMNSLTQVGIVAAQLALSQIDFAIHKCGLVYGTPLGSMSSTEKYIDSISTGGFGHASGIYFPDLVLNSTAGRICHALQLREYSVSISSGGCEDLKSLEIGDQAIRTGKADTLVIGGGHESDSLADKITSAHYDTHSAAVVISNKPSKGSYLVQNVISKSIDSFENLEKILKSEINAEIDTVILQNLSNDIKSDDVVNYLINNGYEAIASNKVNLSDGIFTAFSQNTNLKNVAMVGISSIDELSVANLTKEI